MFFYSFRGSEGVKMLQNDALWKPLWAILTVLAAFSVIVASKSHHHHHHHQAKKTTKQFNVTQHDHLPRNTVQYDAQAVDDLIGTSFQAKWFSQLSNSLCKDLPDTMDGGTITSDPKAIIQSVIDLLKKESQSQNKQLHQVYYDSLEELKSDSDFETLLLDFDKSIKGEKNVMNLGADLPELQDEVIPAIKDVGLRGEVITEDETDSENDLIRYSNYISGSGSTFGGFASGLPQDIKDLTEGGISSMNYKHDALEYRLKRQETLQRIRELDMEIVIDNNIDTETDLRAKRTGVKDVQDVVIDASFDKIKEVHGANNQQMLTQQNFNTQKKLSQTKVRSTSRKLAGKIFKKAGHGVETASTAFSLAQGGIDVTAGSDMIDRAEELRNQDKITDAEYDTMVRNGQLRVAQGSFGLANGVKSVVKFAGKRLEKSLVKNASKHGLKLLAEAKRFGMVVGGVISMGTSATSIAKNAIAAHDAAQAGHTGKAAMYGVMAAVDAVTFVLDGVSLALDFVFPPLSPIVDLVSTVLQVINTILGFIADMVDLRTTAQRVRDEFREYLKSDAFNAYVDNMADSYRERGFDIFVYYVDAEVAGVEADKETLRAENEKVKRCLTDRAEQDFNNPQNRMALLDVTSTGKTLKGRLNDDEIIAGFGPDKIFGEEGDDILYGRGGDDTIYGGPGNDYLNGGTGRDILLGGDGDDIIVCEPAVDKKCKGEKGEDTLRLSGKTLIYDQPFEKKPYITMGDEYSRPVCDYKGNCKLPFTSPAKGIYFDMSRSQGNSQARSGISLGSSFKGYPEGFHEHIHKPAFATPNTDLENEFILLFKKQTLVTLSNSNELKYKLLWFMAEKDSKKYFCDGDSFYEVSESSTRVARSALSKVPTAYAEYSGKHLQFKHNKRLQALLTFAFKKSVEFDKFEKVATARPLDIELYSNFIPTTIIGDNEDNIIDVSYAIGDVVYTGEGNNVVSIGSNMASYRPSKSDTSLYGSSMTRGFKKWAKYVQGGSGDNTLILQYMLPNENSCGPDNYGYWTLVNVDDQSFNVDQGDDYNTHVVYLKNISTVEVHATPLSRCESDKFTVNAKKYHGATRFILDKTYRFYGPTQSVKGVTVLPRSLDGTAHLELNENTINTISFKFYADDHRNSISKIDLQQRGESSPGRIYRRNGESLRVKNVRNVISTPSCKEIYGNEQDNLIVAVGGETTIDARDGDDTLVSSRGRHVLTGGPGADTFVIHGPTVEDTLTISVIMGDDGQTIVCKTTIYGTWKDVQKQLEIDVLQDDHKDVILTSVNIVPAKGDENKNLGSISLDSTKRKMIYSPGSNFNYLKRNKAKVIRVTFTTAGSMTTLKEKDHGNLLKFEAIKGFDDLKISIESDELIFREKTSNDVVLIDNEWNNKFKEEKVTNILGLIHDFAQRFPLILFRQSDKEFLRVTTKEILKVIYQRLKSIESQLKQDYDSFIDSSSISPDNGDEIDVGDGRNVLLAKTKGKTYKLGLKSLNSLVIANKFTGGSGKVVISGGHYDKVNAIVVGLRSGVEVEIKVRITDVIITDAVPSDVLFSKCNSRLPNSSSYDICVKDGTGRVIFTWFNWGKTIDGTKCKKLIFKKSENTQIIMDCMTYVNQKANVNPNSIYPLPVIVSYGSDKRYKLVMPFKKDEAAIHISDNLKTKTKTITFTKGTDTWGFRDVPYLIIPTDNTSNRKIDTKVLVNAFKSQFKGGVDFTGTTPPQHVTNADICSFVVQILKKYDIPYGYTVTNKDLKC